MKLLNQMNIIKVILMGVGHFCRCEIVLNLSKVLIGFYNRTQTKNYIYDELSKFDINDFFVL